MEKEITSVQKAIDKLIEFGTEYGLQVCVTYISFAGSFRWSIITTLFLFQAIVGSIIFLPL